MPAYGRNQTAQFLKIKSRRFLIDCGEATQHQLLRYKIKAQKLNAIFISHLHGDHYLGLVGLLSTLHLQGRKDELHLYGPKGLNDIITLQLRSSETIFGYELIFHSVDTTSSYVLYEDSKVEVTTIPLKHRIPCCGFIFREKAKPIRINKEKIPPKFPLQWIAKLKKGEDIVNDNDVVLHKNEDLTLPPKHSRSYAYCSDTIYDRSLIPLVKNVDLLYHETTFLHEKEIWATNTFHSTTTQAATIAKDAKVGRLLIGHFSARYSDLSPFVKESRSVFNQTVLAMEGKCFSLKE